MFDKLMQFPFLNTIGTNLGSYSSNDIQRAGVDILHAYSQYFQKGTILGMIFRWIESFLFMALYNIDELLTKVIFTILGVNTASDTSKVTADSFQGSILSLLGNDDIQKFILLGMSIGLGMLALVAIYLYGKILLGHRVEMSNVLTNALTSLILLVSMPILLTVSLRIGAYFFVGLATRDISPTANGGYQVNAKKNSIDDFVWDVTKGGIVNVGNAIYARDITKGSGPYYQTLGNASITGNVPDESVINDPTKSNEPAEEAVFGNFPVRYVQNRGAQPTEVGESNLVSVMGASDKNTVTSNWMGQLTSLMVTPADAKNLNEGLKDGGSGGKNDGGMLAKVGGFFKKVAQVVTNGSPDDPDNQNTLWGALSAYTYKDSAYDPTTNIQGGRSLPQPVGMADVIPAMSPNRNFQYALNPAYLVVLVCVGLLLLDIFYKLLVAFFDIIVAFFSGLTGMAMTVESGRGNVVFIESVLNYGKICFVSGASIFLFITTQAAIPMIFSMSGLSGWIKVLAEPITMSVIAMIFLNGSQVFVKMFGADAGFGVAGGLFGAYLGKGAVGKAAGSAGNAIKGLTKKGVGSARDRMMGGQSRESQEYLQSFQNRQLEKQAARLEKNPNVSPESKEAGFELMRNNRFTGKAKDPLQDANAEASILRGRKKAGAELTPEEETKLNDYNMARTNRVARSPIQKATGLSRQRSDESVYSTSKSTGFNSGPIDAAGLQRINQINERRELMQNRKQDMVQGSQETNGSSKVSLRKTRQANASGEMKEPQGVHDSNFNFESLNMAAPPGVQEFNQEMTGPDARVNVNVGNGKVETVVNDKRTLQTSKVELPKLDASKVRAEASQPQVERISQEVKGSDSEVDVRVENGRVESKVDDRRSLQTAKVDLPQPDASKIRVDTSQPKTVGMTKEVQGTDVEMDVRVKQGKVSTTGGDKQPAVPNVSQTNKRSSGLKLPQAPQGGKYD
ncbi:hypothetical protein ACFSJM_06870 [Lactococcus formosensis subsp. bovis]|uniref:hypothetical protein n=1 Tax=Lactococcus formosensis TaxID=1281486 RepID=UPI001BD08FFB|nr:hypothetical protein [Lactococcus formosensis]